MYIEIDYLFNHTDYVRNNKIHAMRKYCAIDSIARGQSYHGLRLMRLGYGIIAVH